MSRQRRQGARRRPKPILQTRIARRERDNRVTGAAAKHPGVTTVQDGQEQVCRRMVADHAARWGKTT
jgi:hypothetical protein